MIIRNKFLRYSVRLTLAFTMLAAAAIFLSFRLSFNETIAAQEKKCEIEANNKLEQIITEINKTLDLSETILRTANSMLYTVGLNNLDTTRIYNAFEQVLNSNAHISGICGQVHESLTSDKFDKYTVLVRRNYKGQLLHPSQQRIFRHRDAEHFVEMNTLYPVGYWTDPFYSEDSMVVVSHSMPMTNPEGEIVGALAIDVNLKEFAQQIDALKPFPQSQIAIIDDSLRIISHPNRGYIMNWTIDQAMRRVGIDPNTMPLNHARERKSGRAHCWMGATETYVYYAPVMRNRWTVLLYLPTNVALEEVNDVKIHMMLIGGCAICMMFFCGIALAWTFHKRRDRRD